MSRSMGCSTKRLLAAAILAMAAGGAGAQDSPADTADVFYQEYLNRLVEDLRLSQIQDLARNWGVVVGGRQLRMNRSFWEQRLSLNLSLGLSPGSDFQTAVVEYQLLPRLMMRGEVGRRAAHSEAWVDFIFHTEY
jgi:hypothetical protein